MHHKVKQRWERVAQISPHCICNRLGPKVRSKQACSTLFWNDFTLESIQHYRFCTLQSFIHAHVGIPFSNTVAWSLLQYSLVLRHIYKYGKHNIPKYHICSWDTAYAYHNSLNSFLVPMRSEFHHVKKNSLKVVIFLLHPSLQFNSHTSSDDSSRHIIACLIALFYYPLAKAALRLHIK